MANTYTQLHIHLVFAVKYRQALIVEKHREEIEKYMTGFLQNKKHKLLAIYLMPDHAHILIGLNPQYSISDTVQVLKTETSNFINNHRLSAYHFLWQEGFGAFSHSKSELDKVIKYIRNQPEHHRKQSFREEYLALLKRFDVEYKEEYLFEFFDDISLPVHAT
ncbi:MAG: IS200/IS605 family transposase [Phycisphaerae bacterium]|nr:IS200/IS605 family transposase [Saprospiraceae bacterium]